MLGQLEKGAFSKRVPEVGCKEIHPEKALSCLALGCGQMLLMTEKEMDIFVFIPEEQDKVGEQGVDQFSGRAPSLGLYPARLPHHHRRKNTVLFSFC